MDVEHLMKRELLRRGYSPRTMNSYGLCLKQFFNYHKDKNPRKITKKDVTDFIDNLVDKNRSGNTINVYFNAIKFFMENILNKRLFYNIKYSKTPKKLPVVLSKEEVKRLIDSIENTKHKLMIKIMYSAGLRVSELTKLKIEDLEIENNYGWVRMGKGRKDRLFIIAKSLKEELRKYIKDNKLTYWLFNGNKDLHISSRTIQEIVRKAGNKAKLNKKIHPHTLRHSFATHLIEDGYDINSIQSLLGHNSPKTTMIYLHVSTNKMINVKSPLDSI